jgi:hypothetical protein
VCVQDSFVTKDLVLTLEKRTCDLIAFFFFLFLFLGLRFFCIEIEHYLTSVLFFFFFTVLLV